MCRNLNRTHFYLQITQWIDEQKVFPVALPTSRRHEDRSTVKRFGKLDRSNINRWWFISAGADRHLSSAHAERASRWINHTQNEGKKSSEQLVITVILIEQIKYCCKIETVADIVRNSGTVRLRYALSVCSRLRELATEFSINTEHYQSLSYGWIRHTRVYYIWWVNPHRSGAVRLKVGSKKKPSSKHSLEDGLV